MAEAQKNFIIDTDAGGDPDDTLAIFKACKLGNVAAFITSDETADGARARFVEQLVHESGSDIPVFTGHESPYPGKHLLGKLAVGLSPQLPSIESGFIDLVSGLSSVHWVGIGSYTNLAWLGRQKGIDTNKFKVTLMGGRLAADPNTRLEHNVKVDPEAALDVVQRFKNVTFLPSTVTMSEKMAVSAGHPALSVLQAKDMSAAVWNFREWFENKYPQSYQHDLETLAYANAAVSAVEKRVSINYDGRLSDDDQSFTQAVHGNFDYDEVWRWFFKL